MDITSGVVHLLAALIIANPKVDPKTLLLQAIDLALLTGETINGLQEND